MDYTNEIWKWIPECEGRYMVSNFGRIRKHFVNHNGPHSSDGVIIEFKPNDYGYKSRAIKIVRNGIKLVKQFKVHRLVGLLFIDNPHNHPMLNHIDGVKINNHHTNLEWTTAKGNAQHAVDTGLTNSRKLTIDEVRELRYIYNTTNSNYSDLALKYNVSNTTIYACVKYLSWDRLDPHLKNTYQTNNLKDNELIEWLSTKTKPKPTAVITELKNIDPILIDEIKYNYVNNKYTIRDIQDVYNLKGTTAKFIVSNDLPEVTLLKDEVFKVFDDYQISNKGRKIKNGRISSDKQVKYIIAKLFLPNPNNYKLVKLINKDFGYGVDNLIWYDNKNNSDFDEEEIINLYLNSEYSKLDMCKKSGMVEKYNISQEMIMNTLKDIVKIKPHLCKICGEDNPIYFNNRKSKCKTCDYNTRNYSYIKKGPRPHLCKTCGEDNPLNFFGNQKGECRTCCKNKTRLNYSTYIKKGPKPHLCKTCGETEITKFYSNQKGKCKTCSNNRKKFPKKFFVVDP